MLGGRFVAVRQRGRHIDVPERTIRLAQSEIGIGADLEEVIRILGLEFERFRNQRHCLVGLAIQRIEPSEFSVRASHQRQQLHRTLQRCHLRLHVLLILDVQRTEVILHQSIIRQLDGCSRECTNSLDSCSRESSQDGAGSAGIFRVSVVPACGISRSIRSE